MRDQSTWPVSSSDLVKLKSVLDSLLAESGLKNSAVSSLQLARSILSAHNSGMTDTQELMIHGRALVKAQSH